MPVFLPQTGGDFLRRHVNALGVLAGMEQALPVANLGRDGRCRDNRHREARNEAEKKSRRHR